MNQRVFIWIYLIGMVATYVVRISGVARAAQGTKKEDILSTKEKVHNEGALISLLMLFWFYASQIQPIVYAFTGQPANTDRQQPVWLGWLGAAVFALSLWLLWRAHHDLGKHWSSTVQIKQDQQLVTDGIYRYLRHPIYTAHILWGVAQAMLLPNWLVGFGALVFIVPVFILRIPNEEAMMLRQFGDAYAAYMGRVGGIFPKLFQQR